MGGGEELLPPQRKRSGWDVTGGAWQAQTGVLSLWEGIRLGSVLSYLLPSVTRQ